MDMPIKVLLVDDEKEFIESLSQRLELRGFDVKSALNGDDALDLIRANDLDVVVLDVLMPERDGIEILQEIKNSRPLLQVIMLTGHATVETAIEGMKLGAYDYLVKPTETDELVDKISKAYELKSEHQERINKAEIDNLLKRRGW